MCVCVCVCVHVCACKFYLYPVFTIQMKTFGIAWSPGPKGAGPSSKRVPPTVDALVDKEMLNESIQSIVDKQVQYALLWSMVALHTKG